MSTSLSVLVSFNSLLSPYTVEDGPTKISSTIKSAWNYLELPILPQVFLLFSSPSLSGKSKGKTPGDSEKRLEYIPQSDE